MVQLKWLLYKAKSVGLILIFTTLMNIILSGIAIYLALVSKALIDAASHQNLEIVFKWIKILAVLFIVQIILRAIVKYEHTYAITKLLNNIQRQLFNHLIHSQWQSQMAYHSMNLLGHISNDAAKITTLICDTLPGLITLSITFLISLITLLNLEPKIALITLLVGPIFAILSLSIRKNMRQIYHKAQDHEIKYNTFMQENLQSLTIVKSFCHETFTMCDFNKLQDKRLHLNLHTCKLTIKADMLLSIGSTLTYFLIFSITAYELACHQISFGTLAALLQLYRNVQSPLSNLAGSITTIIQGLVSVERLMEIEQIPEEPTQLLLTDNENVASSFQALSFQDVNFAYTQAQPILRNINLKIKAGDIIGLVGPSGCGKTTMIRLLLSLIEPSEGKIICEMNGETMALNNSHRQLMSYVPQGNTLFSGTIAENIAYGNPSASFEQIKKAATLAAAWAFIETLKDGLQTQIGEKHNCLSEGQAQRLTIARALLCQKPILILDEATSALDALTELEIISNLKNLEQHPTCIIITHRKAALEICDYVYELLDDYIVEKKKQVLLESNHDYFRRSL